MTLPARLILLLGLLAVVLPSVSAADNTQRKVDSQVWSIHVDIASNVDPDRLQFYLLEAQRLLQPSQEPNDVACCVAMEASSFVTFGSPGDGLDVIDNVNEFVQIAGKKALVMTINWCGSYAPNIAGCGDMPGNTMAVALSANPLIIGMVMAHERGHNAGLPHRGSTQELMAPTASSNHGALDATECNAFRTKFTGTGGTCNCLTSLVGAIPYPDGTSCTENGNPGLCIYNGLCTPIPANDLCANAEVISDGVTWGSTELTDVDGSATCTTGVGTDVWYSYIPTCSGNAAVNTCDSSANTILSTHDACTGTSGNQSVCNDNCASPGFGCRTESSCTSNPVVYDQPLLLRVARGNGNWGPFLLRVSCNEDPLLDTDSDGLTDVLEYGTLGTDPSDPDSDDDGLSDAEEVLNTGTSPLLPDSDADGLDDLPELQLGSDPLDSDSDDDGSLDGADNCLFFPNNQSDVGTVASPGNPTGAGSDGIGDACQCGDLNNNGTVSAADATLLSAHLANPAGVPLSVAALGKCAVLGSGAPCDVLQRAVIDRSIAMSGGTPGILQVCNRAAAP